MVEKLPKSLFVVSVPRVPVGHKAGTHATRMFYNGRCKKQRAIDIKLLLYDVLKDGLSLLGV